MGNPRLPLTKLSDNGIKQMENALKNFGLK